jgi:hypothetical protein
MPELELRLFGHCVVLHGGEVVPLDTRKALGQLAFLSLNLFGFDSPPLATLEFPSEQIGIH